MSAPPIRCGNHNLYIESLLWHGQALTSSQRLLALAASQRTDWASKTTAGSGEVLTKPQWADLTGLSLPTVKAGFAALVKSGWLTEGRSKRIGPGDPSRGYDLVIPSEVHRELAYCAFPHRCGTFLGRPRAHSLVRASRVATPAAVEPPHVVPAFIVPSGSYDEPPF